MTGPGSRAYIPVKAPPQPPWPYLLRNTRKTGRVFTAAAESSSTVWWRGTLPFALPRNTRKTGRVRLTEVASSPTWWWRGTAPFALLAIGLMILGLPTVRSLQAQVPKPTEYEVQAAYLSNFGRFVEWPVKAGANEKEPFYVCVLGQDPFGPLLDAALKGETIGGAPMVAKRVAGVADAVNCRIVYVNTAKDTPLRALLTALGNSNVLTVGEAADFTQQGGMIQFVLEGNRVRFEINLAAAQKAGLNLSSQLLKVAVAIRRTP